MTFRTTATSLTAIALMTAAPAFAQDTQVPEPETPVITTVEEVDLDPSAVKQALALEALDAFWPAGQTEDTVNYILGDYADMILDTPIETLARDFGAQEMIELMAVMYEMGAMDGMGGLGMPFLFPMGGMEEEAEEAVEETMEDAPNDEMTPEQMEAAANMMLAMLGDRTIRDFILEEDQYFDDRLAIVREVIAAELPPIMDEAEPRMRGIMAEVFADKFEENELAELSAFASTTTGQKFADTLWTLELEPNYYRAIIAAMPAFIRGMPNLVEAMETRFTEADLPPMFPAPEPYDPCDEHEDGSDEHAACMDEWENGTVETMEEAVEDYEAEATATEEIEMSDEELAAMYEQWAAEAEADAADYRARAEELRASGE